MRLAAPAKINLYLRVAPPRADGFHPLVSWMTTVALFDTLAFQALADDDARATHLSEPAGAPGRPGPQSELSARIRLSCDPPGLPCDDTNLVMKAAKALAGSLDTGLREGQGARSTSREPALPAVSIHLTKRIPVGAGLGGGSSDAARALQGLNRLWGADRSRDQLAHTAAAIGSDVPFFLYGPSAICRGRGELVQPLSPPQARLALLIFPPTPMPTRSVYQRFDQLRCGHESALQDEPDFRAWSQLDALSLLPLLRNDLETPAFSLQPSLAQLRDDAQALLSRPVRMSGSGSALFSLHDDDAQSQHAAKLIESRLQVRAQVAPLAPPQDPA